MPDSNLQQAVSKRTSKSWSDRFVYSFLAVFACVVLFGGAFEQLVLGWFYFLVRVVPRLTVDWPTAILGLFAIIVFIAGLHPTLRWFVQQAGRKEFVPEWSLRSTFVVTLTLILMFVAGTAMVGATHQFIWYMTSREPHPGDDVARSQRHIPSIWEAAAQAREAAQRTMAKNHLKYIGLGMHNVADTYHSQFPPGGVMLSDGTPLYGWGIGLNGFMSFFSGEVDYSIPWNESPNDRLYKCGISDFMNPCLSGPYFDDQGYGLSHVAGNIHVLPIVTIDPGEITEGGRNRPMGFRLQDITDGQSTTILVGTVVDRFKPWGHPANVRDPALGINRSPEGFGGPPQWHGGMFLMCDGSVKFLHESIDPKLMQALGTPAGGEKIPMDYDESRRKPAN